MTTVTDVETAPPRIRALATVLRPRLPFMDDHVRDAYKHLIALRIRPLRPVLTHRFDRAVDAGERRLLPG